MTGPAGQGASCETRTPEKPTSGERAKAAAGTYCAFCGRRDDAGIRQGQEMFCSEAHAAEFAREVAALQAAARER